MSASERFLVIDDRLRVPIEEIEWQAIRAQGAGGQNVNKVSSAIHLRFDIGNSSLPEDVKQRLLAMSDRRITRDGTVVIKAQQHRTQEGNREDALQRLAALIASVSRAPTVRRRTRPTRASVQRRLDTKRQHAVRKARRRRPMGDD